MNLELLIAKRIHFAKKDGSKQVSTPAIKIAIAGVAIGLAAMILSISIVIGFKKEVRNKVVGFGSHIQIENYDNNTSYETFPILAEDSLVNAIKQMPGIKHVERYTNREGIIKTDKDFQGVIFKGVADDYNWDFFKQNLVEGNIINLTDSSGNQVILSKVIADKLQLKVGDSFLAYFLQENIQARKFSIAGIYNTNFDDYDKLYVITNQTLLQQLNKWNEHQVSGLEILVDDYNKLDDIKSDVFLEMITYQDRDGNTLYTRSIKDINPSIFSWLDLLDTNVVVIIILMFIVSCFTMVSGLLIIILERTSMIGILKAMGHSNQNIRKTFLYISVFLVLKGMLWGNTIALLVIGIQKALGIIKLDPNTYYVSEMPVTFNILYIILINVGTLLISVLMMVGPSYLIAKISPAKSIRFE